MPAQTQQVKQPEKPKRKPVRRDPEKRRQQNLQAQRKYREKLRERLDRLEELAQTAAAARGIETPLQVDTGSAKAAHTPAESGGLSSTTTTNSSSTLGPTATYEASKISVPDLLTSTMADYQHFIPQSYDAPSALTIWDPTLNVPEHDPSLPGMWDPTGYIPQADHCSTSAIQHPTAFGPPSNATPPALRTPDSITLPLQSDSVTLSTPSSTGSPSHVDPSLIFRDDDRPGPRWTTIINCGCAKPHFQIHYSNPKNLAAGEFKMIKFEPTVPAADPYVNNLRIETLCTITAIYHLSEHVGITEEAMCFEDSVSPFFRYDAESADPATQTNIVSTVRGSYKKTLKPDLRPNKEQITIKHHPYIDILPFPELRKSLITRPQDYDEDEFFHDMLFGLVCWGGAGVGKRDRHASTGFASTGTPWDVRSWEGQAWFLKKYWSLLGGEEGELPRQSEWWRSIRGDQPLEIEDLE
ncbi:hypothetical protein BJX63DRAFT_359411 [Aspergillus granulosus]|uniref:KaiA N-terminal domain-containing protein n=1 Tax=Aspergillus granulosus TaxID=176169 RepID=A0ABR4HW23_9EURO